MANSVMQVRVDDDLKIKAAAIYEELGIDLPTAIRMFLKRSVMVNGIPFSMVLPSANGVLSAVQSLSDAAQKDGLSNMTLDEINAEIAATRAEIKARNGEER